MELKDALSVGIAAVVALISALALVVSSVRMREANRIANEANKTAREARDTAREANKISIDSLSLARLSHARETNLAVSEPLNEAMDSVKNAIALLPARKYDEFHKLFALIRGNLTKVYAILGPDFSAARYVIEEARSSWSADTTVYAICSVDKERAKDVDVSAALKTYDLELDLWLTSLSASLASLRQGNFAGSHWDLRTQCSEMSGESLSRYARSALMIAGGKTLDECIEEHIALTLDAGNW